MNARVKREELTKAYPSQKWADKVKRMSERQVIAIYFRMKREGTL